MKKIGMAVWLAGAVMCSGQVYFEAGPWVRGGMDLTVEGGSSAASAGEMAAIPGTQGDRAWTDPITQPDDGTAQIHRTFDDGYVGPSGWAWAESLGFSQYFAYQNAGQYDLTANTLSFTQSDSAFSSAQRTSTRVTSGTAGWSGSTDLDGVGALATLGYTFVTERLFDASIQMQVGWLGGMDASFCGEQTWSQQVTWTRYESVMERSQSWSYAYDTLGNTSFPTAPYVMTDPSGLGPLIADHPISIEESESSFTSTDRVVGRKQKTAISRVDLDADLNAFVLTLGPRLRLRTIERVAILLQGGVTVTLLDADLSRTETFAWEDGGVIQSWTDEVDKQDWLWGATLSAGLELDVTPSVYLLASGGYDWVDRQEYTLGPDRIEVDLSGWNASLALGWRFGGR